MPLLQSTEGSRPPVILRARAHYGPPLFGYCLALALVAVTGIARLAIMSAGEIRAPFLLFYPAIGLASFLAGAGPGLVCIVGGAVFAGAFFPVPPAPVSWIALAILGPLLSTGFAHLRELREESAAVAEQCARFRFISEYVSDWIFLTSESGSIQFANQTARLQFATEGQDLDGRSIEELAAESQKSDLKALLEQCRASGASRSEIAFVRQDGTLLSAEVGCTAVNTGGDVVIHVAARDVTERKQVDEKLREAKQWESLRVLAGGIAHDFNNRLTSIMGNAALASHELSAGHPAAPMLATIQQECRRSAQLVEMMLASSGYRPRFSQPVRLDRIVDRILTAPELPGHIRIHADIAETAFNANSPSLETLLQSLITNAVESYGDSSGEVRVSIRSGAAPEFARGSFEEGHIGPGECLGIVVEDQGCGMPRDVLERAFDPFFSTKFMGRGLGLPAVRGIVRAHSGKLWLRTYSGEGTRVEIWLPQLDIQ